MMRSIAACSKSSVSATDLKSSRRRAQNTADRPSDLRSAAPVEGFPAAGGDGGRAPASPGSRLHRSGGLCLARSGRHVLRALDRAGALPRPMRILARSPHASRLAALPSRLQHAAVELFRGTWCRTVSSRIAMIAPLRTSRSHLPVIVGATTSLFRCHGRCAFGNVCLR